MRTVVSHLFALRLPSLLQMPALRESVGWTVAQIAPQEIDSKVLTLMKAADVTGVALAILNDGQVSYIKAYGFRDTDRKLPLTPDSVMSAASFTKVAFAYMVMELVDKGVLNLDKPVYQYLPKPLPDYPNYKELAGDERYKLITARLLLSHTSGFANLRWLEKSQVEDPFRAGHSICLLRRRTTPAATRG